MVIVIFIDSSNNFVFIVIIIVDVNGNWLLDCIVNEILVGGIYIFMVSIMDLVGNIIIDI